MLKLSNNCRNGVNVSIISDSPILSEEVLLIQAGEAVRCGVSPERALRMITINPAKALGVSERVGSLEVGKDGEKRDYAIPFGAKLRVEEGDAVEAGDPLTAGSINPQDMLRAKGVKGVQEYLTKEVQSAYRLSGVEINDKHIEVIVRQMLRKVRIENQGDTSMLPGSLVDIFTYEDENEKALENGGVPASAKRTLLGITKTALATESFLSAASFQETARVLTEAAIKNKVDPLIGLKENVIIGKLIPAGTGMKIYKNISTVPAETGNGDSGAANEMI